MLNVVVVGVGHLGRHHARILSQIANVNLLGVIDPDRNQGNSVAAIAKSQWYADFDSTLLAKTD